MSHLSPEQFTHAYYGEADECVREHIQQCSQCREEYRLLEEMLHAVRNASVPEPEPDYENQVWMRLLPQLPQRRPMLSFFLRPWILAPALFALLAFAFIAGMLTQEHRHPSGISAQARERVLLISLSDHLERSQALLTELLNTPSKRLDFADERNRARDLLQENRLLRQAGTRAGETARSVLLDDLERVLLDLANSSPDLPADDLQALRTRIQNNGLLFKIRTTSAGMRHEGQI